MDPALQPIHGMKEARSEATKAMEIGPVPGIRPVMPTKAPRKSGIEVPVSAVDACVRTDDGSGPEARERAARGLEEEANDDEEGLPGVESSWNSPVESSGSNIDLLA